MIYSRCVNIITVSRYWLDDALFSFTVIIYGQIIIQYRALIFIFQVPTLIIYGEKDKGLGYASRDDLSKIPTSQAVELAGAKHPAYLDQPHLFHTLLYNFIKQVHIHRALG